MEEIKEGPKGILIGELEAIELYGKAIAHFSHPETIKTLFEIQLDHTGIAFNLIEQFDLDKSHGVKLKKSFVDIDEVNISRLEKLVKLEQFETNLIKTYEAKLFNCESNKSLSSVLRESLLPSCHRHINNLNKRKIMSTS